MPKNMASENVFSDVQTENMVIILAVFKMHFIKLKLKYPILLSNFSHRFLIFTKVHTGLLKTLFSTHWHPY
jgi:hypothetical protein